MSKEVTFGAEIQWETDKALLLFDGDNEFWIPKSQIIDQDEISAGNFEFTIPEWLAIEAEII